MLISSKRFLSSSTISIFICAITKIYFKAENLVLRARVESFGFAEIVNEDRMVGIKAFMPFRVQSKNQ